MLLLPGDISLFFYEATDFIQPPWLIKVHKNLEAFQALPLKRRRKRKYVRGSWLQMVVAFRCNQGELGCLVCIKEALPPPQPPSSLCSITVALERRRQSWGRVREQSLSRRQGEHRKGRDASLSGAGSAKALRWGHAQRVKEAGRRSRSEFPLYHSALHSCPVEPPYRHD